LNLSKKSNSIIIAIGEAGENIVKILDGKVNSDYLFIKRNGLIDEYSGHTIKVVVENILNPSPHMIRKVFLEFEDKLLEYIQNKKSIIIIGNLASSFGSAILPILGKSLKNHGINQVVCFVILPFSFEKLRLFRSGVSLKLLAKSIKNLVVIDNSAIQRNEIEVQIKEYYETINQAVSDIIIESFNKCFPSDLNMISTNLNTKCNLGEAFIDTIASMTNRIDISDIEKCSLYLYGESTDITSVRNIMESTNFIMPHSNNDVNIIGIKKQQTRCHIIVNTGMQFISSYDPLDKLISKKNILDFEPEIAIAEEVNLKIIKNLE
jgi:cell division protein FtsZ